MGVKNSGNGKRFIDVLIAASPTERRKFTLLGQDIFFKPVTRKALQDAMPKDDVERDPDYTGLFALVHLAEHADGSKVFQRTDIEALRTKVSVHLLHELEAAMQGVIAPSAKESDKAVEADPPSASV